MTMSVLQSRRQISAARQILDERGLSSLAGPLAKMLARIGLNRGPVVGDALKSWDVLKTVEFIESRLDTSARILDIGAYASEILPILYKLGFRQLAGVDLNPRLPAMPHSDVIDFRISDFMRTPFSNSEFDMVTSISVIEHGYDGKRLFLEIARLLKPGGFFIASFDYWPEKISTDGIAMFGMDWRIFSRADIGALLDEASAHGLDPVGPFDYEAEDRPISCAGKDYSFAWLALQKRK